ncbi:hypothetical protein ES675_16335 [Bizionia algoritergicola]|uniref:Lipoprotein n=3 Tax=Bizionia TaxID=283785 RepID=A0A5D0QIM2_9FLAO|nr:hypothetical protein BAA08_16365 [Bizionia sp. APA-3]TYB69030.1 hypothetical protein ES675_16335 [Bizionia algoritergicola]
MKIFPFILTFVILSSCVDSKKSIQVQTKIDIELIENIYIKKRLNETDSIRLNNKQTELFVTEWNIATSEGLYKMGPEFWIIVKLKNDSIRKFRTNRNLIKEKNDWTYSVSDSTLVSSFWKPELIHISQTDSISELWNILVFEKGGCLGGEQYISETEFKREEKPLVFSEMDWKNFSKNDKEKLTEFLITKLSDTTKTKVHTCPFFGATNGEMAVYSLQHIHNKNWFDFFEFKEYKDKEYKSATEQPQMWLQNILKNETDRKKIAELYKNELKK